MSELRAVDFRSYFKEIYGYEPFPWQQRLTDEVLSRGSWPDVIDLPTGTGKTAVLDTAVFALAAQPEVFSRRIVFVIDRRIVVDQVATRAALIESKVREASSTILRQVRDRLTEIGGGSPLHVAALRGGIPIDNEWAHRPDQPQVLVSTVDQFGSRLLFRGYGVTPKMRPIHAGLAGNDCLVILDEVHLSLAFKETLHETAKLNDAKGLPRRFYVVEMSATPTNSGVSRFHLTEADLEQSAELRRRAKAAKSATLLDAGTKSAHEALPIAVKKILKSELDDPVRSVGVIVNRVRTAREIHRALIEAGYSAYLLTGRMRSLDKARAIEGISRHVDPDRFRDDDDVLTVVVATQAIEVGADFSFDALITEVAPINSLRQRIGRLDRRGLLAERTQEPAKVWIIGVRSALNPKRPDPIYGDSVRATWKHLQSLDDRKSIDFTPCSDVPHDFPHDCYAPSKHAPLLLRTYMDAWVQTNPEPIVQPDIDWFLHGIDLEASNIDVAIAWRQDQSLEALKEVPLRPVEYLHVPVDAAKAWLTRSISAGLSQEVPVADVNGRLQFIDNVDETTDTVCYRWLGHDTKPEEVAVSAIKPGDVLIVDPQRGGLSSGVWDPSSVVSVADLGDESQAAYGQRFTLRLDDNLIPQSWPPPPRPTDEATAVEPLSERIEQWIEEVSNLSTLSDWQRRTIDSLKIGYDIRLLDDYYVLVVRRVDPSALDGSDQSASFTGSGITLHAHLQGVGKRVADYALRLGLSTEVREDLELAAQLHDLGKVDSRFQSQLVGDDIVRYSLLDEPLAKSLRGAWPSPKGWPPVRHELMSVAMIQSNRDVLTNAYDPDLVLYLVGTHHGYSRPLPPIQVDSNPEVLRYEHNGHRLEASTDLAEGYLALNMADRFWRLVERYGHHGLAWLEAILRLADHQQSAEEARR